MTFERKSQRHRLAAVGRGRTSCWKNEQIVVEAKMTRTMAATKEVCFELMEDAAHYWRHSDCKKLVCLVYDPPGLIKDPRGVERYGRSLSSESLDVEVIVVPKD
jgi:hypothetical protein